MTAWFIILLQIPTNDADFALKSARVINQVDSLHWVFTLEVEGVAGGTTPTPRGTLDQAPVLAYVFITNLSPMTVGFDKAEGLLALAITSHPDFDDTPLWDENQDGDHGNDGVIYHTHWVVLQKDDRVPGGFSVQATASKDLNAVLPPTNPGMPMYMDSPGFQVGMKAGQLRVWVPHGRLNHASSFNYDVVTAYLQVSTSGTGPMLGVHKVFSILSNDLSLPFESE